MATRARRSVTRARGLAEESAAKLPTVKRRMFNATDAKNRFGVIMKIVDNAEPVFIEKHGAARAVVLDIDSYTALLQKAQSPDERKLVALRAEFEQLYAAMQSAKSRAGADALLSATAEELNKVARARLKPRG
jgi:prevent-host-death family protein